MNSYFLRESIKEAIKHKKFSASKKSIVNKIYDNEVYHYIQGVDSDEMLAKKVYDLKLLPKELNNLYHVDWDFINWSKVGDYLIVSEDWELTSISFIGQTYHIAIKINYDKIPTDKPKEIYVHVDDNYDDEGLPF